MINFTVPSVTQGLHKGLEHLKHHGKLSQSRNGPVLVGPWPVLTTYTHPTHRVLSSPLRNANPFFHVMEALWMLAGRNDLSWPRTFNEKFKEFSDDGSTLHGAYGHRWRRHFGVDQLVSITQILRKSPEDRRCVLSMWDPVVDLGRSGNDFPCNTHAYFDLRDGALNLTVCCRSNDIWWGCYGANAVHFSFLLEYMAASVGAPIGVYRQLSNNFHLYPDIVGIDGNRHNDLRYDQLWAEIRESDFYTKPTGVYSRVVESKLRLEPLVGLELNAPDTRMQTFDAELEWFMEDADLERDYLNPFFPLVAQPMFRAWVCYKNKFHEEAFKHAHAIAAGDWALACIQWLERKADARLAKKIRT